MKKKEKTSRNIYVKATYNDSKIVRYGLIFLEKYLLSLKYQT